MNRVAPTRSRWPASQRLFLWRKDALHAPQRHVRTSARRSRVATRRLGDIPVAVLKPDGTGVQIDAVHTDHLNTPRMLMDANGQVRWRWLGEPFGASPAEEQPTAGLAPVQQQLRFPGQQYEAFGGRHYNHFRDYDATVGRYVQSDPIGLAGGINTYAYVGADPISGSDPDGLQRRAGGNSHQRRVEQRALDRAEAQRRESYLNQKRLQDELLRSVRERCDCYNNIADAYATITGAGESFRHPSVPHAFESLVNPRRKGSFVETVPLPKAPGCTVIPLPQPTNACSSKPAIIEVCGSVVGAAP